MVVPAEALLLLCDKAPEVARRALIARGTSLGQKPLGSDATLGAQDARPDDLCHLFVVVASGLVLGWPGLGRLDDAPHGLVRRSGHGGRRSTRSPTGGSETAGENGDPEPWVPRRCPFEEDKGPDRATGHYGSQGHPRPQPGSVRPPLHGADANYGGDSRGQRHRVVGVDDPLAEAEHRSGHHQPATPQQHGRPESIRPRGARRLMQRLMTMTRPGDAAGRSQAICPPMSDPNKPPQAGRPPNGRSCRRHRRRCQPPSR